LSDLGSHRLPFHHDDKEHATLVPTADPADTPTINAIPNRNFFEKPQKLSLNVHGDPCMARRGGTIKATTQQVSDCK
jgi:hypothetical protein